jgi:hypothetical protein
LVAYVAAAGLLLVAFVGAFDSIVLHPESRLLNGFGFSDAAPSLRTYWATSYQGDNPLTFRHDKLSGAPQADNASPALVLANGAVQTAFVWVFHDVLGWVGAWNAFFLLTMLASGLAMFAFLDWLGCGFLAALFGAYVFSFNTYALERAYSGHLGLLANWVFVLLLALLLWSRRWSLQVASAAIGGTIALAFYNSAYLGLFAGFMVFVYFAVDLAAARGSRGARRALALSLGTCLCSLLALLPVLLLYAGDRSAVRTNAGHSIGQIYAYSISGLRYLEPSPRNPLVRRLTGEHWSRYLSEHSVFFGYTTLVLAVVGFVLFVLGNAWLSQQYDRRQTCIFIAALGLASFVMSLGPKAHLGSLELPMPSDALAHVTTFWRVYARFGVLVGFALAIAAGLTLTAISKLPGRFWSAVPLVALMLVVFELVPGNVGAVNTNAKPKWVQWLVAHPKGIVASYPFFFGKDPAGSLITRDYWYQTIDHHPRFQSRAPDLSSRAEAIRFLASDVTQPLAAQVLAAEGVRYVVLHDYVYRAERQSVPNPYSPYFALRARFGPVQIYSVRAPRVNIDHALAANEDEIARLLQQQEGAGVVTGNGFNKSELYHGVRSAWMTQNGVLRIVNSGERKRVKLDGIMFSNQTPRLVVLTDHSGQVIGRQIVPPFEVKVRFPTFDVSHGTTNLRLTAYPGPMRLGPSDGRIASVFLSGLTASPLPVWTISENR